MSNGITAALARYERSLRMQRKFAALQALVPVPRPDPGPLMDYIVRASPHLRRPDHMEPFADLFEEATVSPVEAAVSFGVRQGKTTFIKHGIVWWLERDPTEQILYGSYAHDFAAEQVDSMRQIAVDNGIPLGRVQRRDLFTTAAGGFVLASGVGGQLTGRGFTKVVIDDAHKNREEAESPRMREKTVERFYNDIYTRRDRRGTSFFVVGARWHVNDLPGVVVRGDRPFRRYNFPVINEQGEALAPWLLRGGLDELLAIRDTVGPYIWASLYMGEPRRRGGNLFREIDPVPPSELVAKGPTAEAIGIDLARTARTRSDHHAAVHMRRHMSGVVDVLGAIRMRGVITDRSKMVGDVPGDVIEAGFISRLAAMMREAPAAVVVWYIGHGEEYLVMLVERELSATLGRRVRIVALQAENRDKWHRSQHYAAGWNLGRVRIPAGPARDGWQQPFLVEHFEFKGDQIGEENDQVDAATASYDWLERHPPGSVPIQGRGTGEGSEADRMGGLL